MQVPEIRYLAPKPGSSPLSKLFYGEMGAARVKCYEMESRLGCSPQTLRRWLQHPEQAGMDKVMQIAKCLGISKSRVCEAWKW